MGVRRGAVASPGMRDAPVTVHTGGQPAIGVLATRRGNVCSIKVLSSTTLKNG